MIPKSSRARLALGGVALAAVATLIGFGLGRMTPDAAPAPTAQAEGRKVLYWYDPMAPAQRFDKPGKSPFMDMELVPKYADEGGAEAGAQIDPAVAQNLGVRVVAVERGRLGDDLTATGVVEFNQRDVAIVQPRTGGFVQRVYRRAPGDVIVAGAPIADLLVPEWGGAQAEFLALVRTGDARLIAAGRRRLELLGISPAAVSQVERSRRPINVITITSPIGGAIQKLDVRSGMSVSAGQTLAEVNGLSSVWLTAALPETQAARVRAGQSVTAELAAYPGETFAGRVTAILPQLQAESRTLPVRIELSNPSGRLHPGLFATVRFAGESRTALLVPSETVIRTGRRALVMLAKDSGRYQAAEVRTGREANGRTEILAGLAEGERIVASGQFLIDSEASLSGVQARPIGAADGAPTVHQSHKAPSR